MRELTERYKASIIDGIPESNLVLYCPGLHGLGSSLFDRSANANHGTITGATWTRLPSGIYVLSFDGLTNRIAWGNNASLFPTVAVTLEFWVYSNQAVNTVALSSSFADDIGGILSYLNAGTRVRFYLENVRQDLGSTATDITGNTWHHIALTYDSALGSNNFIYYIDGAAVRTVSTTNAITYTGTKAAGFSQNVGGGVSYFSGKAALWRQYNRALGATEVLRHYTRERRLFGV